MPDAATVSRSSRKCRVPVGRLSGSRRMACLEPMLSRRQLLAASPTALPLFLALSACKGPAVLAAPPTVSHQTRVLLHAVTAELNLIWIYDRAIAVYSGLEPRLAPLRAEHEAHLAELRGRVIMPAGKKVPQTVTSKPAIAATQAAAVDQLQAAEQAAVRTLMSRLGGASPSLAQLYASIAASEATHASVLGAKAGG